MPEPVAAERRYIGGLDGLRALAVLAVLAYHLGLPWTPGGLLGVGVFFTLSGYLITDLLLGQRETRGSIQLGQFWLRRARRLLPALWIVLAAVIVWSAVAQPASWPASATRWWPPWLRQQLVVRLPARLVLRGVRTAISARSPLVAGRGGAVLPGLAAAAACGLCVSSTAVLVALTLVGAAVARRDDGALAGPALDPSRMYYGTDTRAFELLVGAALAFVWPSTRLATRCRACAARRSTSSERWASSYRMAGLGHQRVPAVLYRGGMVLAVAGRRRRRCDPGAPGEPARQG